MGERESFLSRWSRRKANMREDPPGEAGAQDTAAEPAEPVDLSALPDIEELCTDSDFAAFMQPGVPDMLRTRALRKLWALDPRLSRMDGLLDYNEDYRAASRTRGVVTTAWRLGKGMPGPEAEDAEDSGAGEPIETAAREYPPEDPTPPDPAKAPKG